MRFCVLVFYIEFLSSFLIFFCFFLFWCVSFVFCSFVLSWFFFFLLFFFFTLILFSWFGFSLLNVLFFYLGLLLLSRLIWINISIFYIFWIFFIILPVFLLQSMLIFVPSSIFLICFHLLHFVCACYFILLCSFCCNGNFILALFCHGCCIVLFFFNNFSF